jgi:flavorubredoxin
MKAIVLYDTLYGNTEMVARALARGIEESGVRSKCSNIAEADVKGLTEYDLIAVGGPTHYRTASQPMQEFLTSLRGFDFHGQMAFAFDTRKDSFWAGSAAKYIERELRSLGLTMIWPPLSAAVFVPEGAEDDGATLTKEERKERERSKVRLAEKVEELFQRTGREIGRTLSNVSSHPGA